jgi:hypothetical protein
MYQGVLGQSTLGDIVGGSQACTLFNVEDNSEENEVVPNEKAKIIAGKCFCGTMPNEQEAKQTCDGFSTLCLNLLARKYQGSLQ